MTSTYTTWYHKQREMLINDFGGKCAYCGSSDDLEFAHIHGAETGVGGEGRGSYKRLKDWKEFSECYVLLCKADHVKYDHNKITIK